MSAAFVHPIVMLIDESSFAELAEEWDDVLTQPDPLTEFLT